MKRFLFFFFSTLAYASVSGQELYPYTEPASNNPAKSIAVKGMAMLHGDQHSSRTLQRYMTDVTFGISKKLMLRAGTNLSNMHQPGTIWEGGRLYGKYRFLSNDGVHKHFRMAAFALAGYSKNHLDHNEINLAMGEQSGVQAGLVATQLWNKLAVSGTLSWNEVLDGKRSSKFHREHYAFQAVNYSLSAGYLLLPFEYKDYSQTNLNLYVELLGGRNINFDNEKYYVDLAPSVQAIFNSAAKLNVGYRFQLSSDIYRLTKNSFLVSFEYLFLDALRKRPNR